MLHSRAEQSRFSNCALRKSREFADVEPSFVEPMLRYVGELHGKVDNLRRLLNTFAQKARYEDYHNAAYFRALEEERRALQNLRARNKPSSGDVNDMYNMNMLHHNPRQGTTFQNAEEGVDGVVHDNDTPYGRRRVPSF